MVVLDLLEDFLVDDGDEVWIKAVTVHFSLFYNAIDYVVGNLCHSPLEFLIDGILEFWALTIEPVPTFESFVVGIDNFVGLLELLVVQYLSVHFSSVISLKLCLKLLAEDIMIDVGVRFVEVHDSTDYWTDTFAL